uniref:Uncharacterized protein n=1 Tax=Lepeophtheirus salmonis TaxID=72036 RepID=A0A0K2VC65_LEPSM
MWVPTCFILLLTLRNMCFLYL